VDGGALADMLESANGEMMDDSNPESCFSPMSASWSSFRLSIRAISSSTSFDLSAIKQAHKAVHSKQHHMHTKCNQHLRR